MINHESSSCLTVVLVMGMYYTIMGIWPLIHYNSFEKITGYKEEKWLVKTVSFLIVSVGMGLIASWWIDEISLPVFIIAILSCASLAFIDLNYVSKLTIRKIYLADAVIEVLLLLLLIDTGLEFIL